MVIKTTNLSYTKRGTVRPAPLEDGERASLASPELRYDPELLNSLQFADKRRTL
jgi:hypothetical protein